MGGAKACAAAQARMEAPLQRPKEKRYDPLQHGIIGGMLKWANS
jgi:hypothetical protein